MKTRIFLVTILGLALLNGCKQISKIMPAQIQATALSSPIPFNTSRNTHVLAYEIILSNSASSPEAFIQKIDIYDEKELQKPLITYKKQFINIASTILKKENSTKIHAPKTILSENAECRINPGEQMVVFIWIERGLKKEFPQGLLNRIYYSKSTDKNAGQNHIDLKVSMDKKEPLTLLPPVKGKNWAATGGPSRDSFQHKTIFLIDDKPYFSQRYAVDWIIVDEKSRFASGDLSKNKSYFCYDKDVYAAADGTVISVKDGTQENVPGEYPQINLLEQTKGNNTVIEIGKGNYLFYGNLAKIFVKPQEKVKQGQKIALIGNSGEAAYPQLHFQLSNGPDPLKSEGLPYVLSGFTSKDRLAGEPEISKGIWRIHPRKNLLKSKNQMPLNNEVVDF